MLRLNLTLFAVITCAVAAASTHFVRADDAAIPPAAQTAPADPNIVEFQKRLGSLKETDVNGRLDLARWASERQLLDQSASLASAILAKDPTDGRAYYILQQIDAGRGMPLEPDTEEHLRTDLQTRFHHVFKATNSHHFVFIYDASEKFAADCGDEMELVYSKIFDLFVTRDLHPAFLTKRLVVILLSNREEYLEYLRQIGTRDASWTAGMYDIRENHSVFYDDTNDNSVESIPKQLDSIKTRLAALNAQIAAATQPADRLEELVAQRAAAATELERLIYFRDIKIFVSNRSTTMHEAAHQIAFNTGIQTRFVDYPMWLAEGLATGFEVSSGPATITPLRLARVKAAARDHQLRSIETIVTEGRPDKMNAASLDLYYAQSCALFHFLFKCYRSGLNTYLLECNRLHPLNATTPELRRKLFTTAFGNDWEKLNAEFLAYMQKI